MILRRLKDGIRSKFSVSVAEVLHQELWQRSVLAVALVACSLSSAREQADSVVEEVSQLAPAELIRQEVEYL